MIRKTFQLSLLLLAAVVVLAGLLTSPAAAGENPKAFGHGNLTRGGKLRTFSFTAVQHSDGAVTGEAALKNRAFDFRDHYKIDCLKFEGPNRTIVSGPLTMSNDPNVVGFIGVFAVEDNSEGQDAPIDRISGVFLFNPPTSCSDFGFSDFELSPIEAGNIQVKP